MAKFKVGDKVRILDASKIAGGSDYWKDGDVYEVVGDDRRDIYVVAPGSSNGYWYVTKGTETPYIEKVEVVPSKPTKNQRIAALEQQVETLLRRVEALENGTSYTHTPRLSVEDVKPVSANEQRKAIIDAAKAFVEDVTRRMSQYGHGNVLGEHGEITTGARGWITKAEFVVNAEKRTVVALARGFYSGYIHAKGIAKCAPDDVFNADIGKAIALGRALGLDVSKFEQAVQPTEVVVGMIVKAKPESFFDDTPYTVKKIVDDRLYDDPGNGWIYDNMAIILDDTEAQY